MTKQILLSLSLILWLTSCSQKPSHHPKNPNYKITKPKVKYKPNKKNLGKMIKELQGSPYVWAEEGPYNFDCSGFTYYLYGSMGINIPRVARNQAKVGKRVAADDLQYGDLIFFATSKKSARKITHVGMYLGKGWFTHASTVKHEVIYSNLFTSPYYKKRLRVCRRYLPDMHTKVATTQTKPKPMSVSPWKTREVITPIHTTGIKENNFPDRTLQKAIVIKAPLKEIEQSSSSGNYYVQVGSFIGEPKHALVNQIKSAGFTHKIIRFPKEGREVSKLLIGPYLTREATLPILETVRQNIQKDAFIAEIR